MKDVTYSQGNTLATFEYVVTNTGETSLTDVVVTDDAGTPGDTSDDVVIPVGDLAPGASATVTHTFAIAGNTSGGGGGIPQSNIILSQLASAGPSQFAVLSLGGDPSYSKSGINCSNATVNGNVGVASIGKFNNAAPCTETGMFYKGNSVTYSGPGKLKGGTITDEAKMDQAVTDALAAAAYFGGFNTTDSSVQAQFGNGNISGNKTVKVDVPNMYVVNLPQLTLNGNLTLSGPPGTQFILNIAGTFNLHSGNIKVAGGMGPFDVLYNITNPNASVKTMVPTTAVGILLAPYNAINAMDSSHFYGEIIGGKNKVITLMSGTRVEPPFVPPPPPCVTNTATATATVQGDGTVTATATATVSTDPSVSCSAAR